MDLFCLLVAGLHFSSHGCSVHTRAPGASGTHQQRLSWGCWAGTKRRWRTGGTNPAGAGSFSHSWHGNPLWRRAVGKARGAGEGRRSWAQHPPELGLLFWNDAASADERQLRKHICCWINIVSSPKLWHPFDVCCPDYGSFWSPAFSFLGRCWQLGWGAYKKKPINKIKLYLRKVSLGAYLLPNLNSLNTFQKIIIRSHSPIYRSKK